MAAKKRVGQAESQVFIAFFEKIFSDDRKNLFLIVAFGWKRLFLRQVILIMIFENSQIPVSAIPQIEDVDFQQLAPAYRTVELVASAIFFTFLLIGWLFFYLFNQLPVQWPVWVALGAWMVLFALSLYLSWKRWVVAGYALREHDITHQHGVLFRTVTTIPFNRMQHCEISRGPVESAFGLATLRVFTAGGSSSDLSIEGLPVEEAQRIKEFITQKIGESTEL